MTKTISTVMMFLLLTSMLTLTLRIQPARAAAVDEWPMFHHDASHTGTSTSTGPPGNHIPWNYTTGGWVESSPAVVGGLIYVGSDDRNVYCLNAANGTLAWEYTTSGWVESSPAVVGGLIYLESYTYPSYSGHVYCLNAANGTLVWEYATGWGASSSPAVVGGLVYVGSDDHNVYCLNAATGTQVWNYTTGGWVESSPAVVGGLVYVGSGDGNVYCLDASHGSLVWTYTTGGFVGSSPAVVGGLVYVGSDDHNVYCLNAATGTQVWNYTTGGDVWSSSAVVGGLVYVGSYDHNVYCLNAATGEQVWNYTTGDAVGESSPAVADGRVFVGSWDRKVYCLNAATGALVWDYTTGGWVTSSPVMINGVVYVGSSDGKIYAFGANQCATFVVCSSNIVYTGSPVTCTASVSGLSGFNLTGTVTWSTNSITGSFSQKVCTLSSQTCSTTYTDTSSGTVIITANYGGDLNDPPSSGSTTLTVWQQPDFPIYINPDGSISPATAPISTSDYFTYTFKGDIIAPLETGQTAIMVERDNITIDGNGHALAGTLADESIGINLSNRSNVMVQNVQIDGFCWGIYLDFSSNDVITGNNITYASDIGIKILPPSDGNTISSNNIRNSVDYGILLGGGDGHSSNGNKICGNNITGNIAGGITADPTSHNCIISDNNIAGNDGFGISIDGNSNTTVCGNKVTGNYGGGIVVGSNDTVCGNNVTNNGQEGISTFVQSSNDTICGNIVLDNGGDGVWITSNNTIICGNNVARNNGTGGIWLFNSYSSIVSGNNVTNSKIGIVLSDSSDNTVSENNLANNERYGISLNLLATNNKMFHNNFMNNSVHVCSYGSPNVWDDGYPSGGNYWDDYLLKYPNATEIDASGIGDIPYVIDSNNTDNYPLIRPSNATASLPFDFVVSTSGNLFTVNKGGSVSIPVSVNPVSGTAERVSLVVAWIPTGSDQWFTTSFSTSSGYPPFASTLTINASSSTPAGTYTLQILASAKGDNVESTTPTIAVNPVESATAWNASIDFYNLNLYDNGQGWGTGGINANGSQGYCYGLSSTAILYYDHYILNNPNAPFYPSQYPEAQNTYDLLPPREWEWIGQYWNYAGETELSNASLAAMIHEIYDPQVVPNPPPGSVNELNEFEQLVSYLTEDQPVVLGLGNTNWGHGVVAWKVQELLDGTGTYNISISDPANLPSENFGTYNPITNTFSYTDNGGAQWSRFCVINPGMISKSWFTSTSEWSTLERNDWIQKTVENGGAGYDIIIADKSVTITTSNGLEDYFTTSGNSETFVRGIQGSSGIEEGDMQVYAIPNDVPWFVLDPASSNSMLLITCVNNESGQPVGYGYLLNATTTQGLLNYTAMTSGSGLSITTGNNALNASVTFFYATEQNYSFFQASNIRIYALQTANFTVSNWQTLNETGIQVVPEFPDRSVGIILILSAVLSVALATAVRWRKIGHPQGARSSQRCP